MINVELKPVDLDRWVNRLIGTIHNDESIIDRPARRKYNFAHMDRA